MVALGAEPAAAVTPTLSGRIQTRLVLLVVIGIPWTALIGLVLPRPEGASLVDLYRLLLDALILVAVVGIAWELLYHALQQLRWEKDWPTFYGLLTGIPEGVAVYLLLANDLPVAYGEVLVGTFVIHFATTWIVVWLTANGPMRLVLLRWRFRGGRIV